MVYLYNITKKFAPYWRKAVKGGRVMVYTAAPDENGVMYCYLTDGYVLVKAHDALFDDLFRPVVQADPPAAGTGYTIQRGAREPGAPELDKFYARFDADAKTPAVITPYTITAEKRSIRLVSVDGKPALIDADKLDCFCCGDIFGSAPLSPIVMHGGIDAVIMPIKQNAQTGPADVNAAIAAQYKASPKD